MNETNFECDEDKNLQNQQKHHVSFENAQFAFLDNNRVIAEDIGHSLDEQRYFRFGMVNSAVLTVRFTYRDKKIRIFGAGYWRKGKKIYEKRHDIQR